MTEDTSKPQEATPVLMQRLDGEIALITINRPHARNALTAAVWAGLERLLAQAGQEGTVAVVLTGAGNYFSAGGDLKTPPSGGKRAFAPVQRLQLAHRVLAQIAAMPIPVIAAVERGAVGLGWGLALACDLVIASREAAFVAPFLARGVVPDGGMGWILTRRMGPQRALDLMLSGRAMGAEEAHSYGLVARVADPGQAVQAAVEYACALPAGAAHAMELTRRLLRQADTLNFSNYLEQELLAATLCQSSPEAVAGRDAFLAGPDRTT